MAEAGDGTLLRVAEALMEGSPVDWEAEERTRPDLTKSFELLRQVEVLARMHRGEAKAAMAGQDARPAGEPLGAWGSLEILERIGDGSYGEVYRAFDPALRIEVALKLWRDPGDPQAPSAEEFLTEARQLALVRHPNVLVVHGAGWHDGRAGMWTELLVGRTVEDLLAQQGPASPDEAAVVGMDLCRALAAVHAAGLIHGDVKAANVMREKGGRIVLMDFGCSGESRSGGVGTRGTPMTMAPEQLAGAGATPATDIHALGVLLYRLLTGRYPVEAESIEELIRKHSQRGYIPLRDRRPDLPAQLVRVVEKAMDPEPGRRFRSVGEMERGLAEAVGVAPPRTNHVKAPPPARPTRSSRAGGLPNPWRLLAGLGVAAALVIGGAILRKAVIERKVDGHGRSMPASGVEPGAPGRATVPPIPDRSSPEITAKASARAAGPPSPPVAGPRLTARASLFRARSGTDERLATGSRVAPGDALFLEVEGSEDLYVYVLDEDSEGHVFVLFPSNAFDRGNPLARGGMHRLPGTREGRQMNWQVTSATGKETFIVVGSRRPLGELERDIVRFPVAAPGTPVSYSQVSEHVKQKLFRGIGGALPASPAPQTGRPALLAEILRNLVRDAGDSGDPFIWLIQLENPASPQRRPDEARDGPSTPTPP